MKLDEIYEEIQKDFPINKAALDDESVKTSKLFIKWIRIWSDESLMLKRLQNRAKDLERQKREYYTGHSDPETYRLNPPKHAPVRVGPQLQKLIDEDADIIKNNEAIIIQEQKVLVLYNCLDEIKRRGYAIKNCIEYIRFMAGS